MEPFYDFREELVQYVLNDLLGPSGGVAEMIDDAPLDRYAMGVLWPQYGTTIEGSEDWTTTDDGGDEDADPPISMANIRYPASIGLTFSVGSETASITTQVSAARYEEVDDDQSNGAGAPARSRSRRASHTTKQWKRVPLECVPVAIDVSAPTGGKRVLIADGLELYWRVRAPGADEAVSITLVLLNTHHVATGLRDAFAFFQSEIAVSASTHAFIERHTSEVADIPDEDLDAYRLIYRYARSFAIGHGCSVRWADPDDTGRTARIWTTFAPSHEVLVAESNPAIETAALDIRFLAESKSSELEAGLRELCTGYETWIDGRRVAAADLPHQLRVTAERHLGLCSESLARMRRGIDLIARDSNVRNAFQLANAAMLHTRARGEWIRNGRVTVNPPMDEVYRWYPFQLAFILMCLEGLADGDSSDRDLVDLLWFPTGGGKTEAYLGLIAFSIFMRRIRSGGQHGGVTALMRYTLRLLTIQQFQRAALLICACEMVRRDNSALGTTPVSIGLWVGQGATPNTLDQARQALTQLRTGHEPEEGNPVQLHHCPWCGAALDANDYGINRSLHRLVVACHDPACDFANGLPVVVVDEDIYAVRPSLIIGTVDKFAALPWNDNVARLFNIDTGEPPPELIVQDELHLISGPLGTLTGLYETVVDLLCTTHSGVRPKIVASTATIRRAAQQGEGLFARDVRQFPPPALDARDSYFAVEAPRERRGAREYLGLMAPGTSQATLMVRVYAALLQGAKQLNGSIAARDPYWTLVGYFNSLRVLGGARVQLHDDVVDRIRLLAAGAPDRTPLNDIELTSRTRSGEIPAYLAKLAASTTDPDALDVVLATNMISVGVDVDRLGLMAVMGQPQSTAEYIQATSRVGRRYPGLVVVLFNSARSRDRSHYEAFPTYHAALYRQVEATSVTPFSARARDRGLHAVFVALVRMLLPPYRANDHANAASNLAKDAAPICDLILRRVARVAPGEVQATALQLEAIIEEWVQRSEDEPDLRYATSSKSQIAALLSEATEERDYGEFPTLRSLRDVDQASGLYLVR